MQRKHLCHLVWALTTVLFNAPLIAVAPLTPGEEISTAGKIKNHLAENRHLYAGGLATVAALNLVHLLRTGKLTRNTLKRLLSKENGPATAQLILGTVAPLILAGGIEWSGSGKAGNQAPEEIPGATKVQTVLTSNSTPPKNNNQPPRASTRDTSNGPLVTTNAPAVNPAPAPSSQISAAEATEKAFTAEEQNALERLKLWKENGYHKKRRGIAENLAQRTRDASDAPSLEEDEADQSLARMAAAAGARLDRMWEEFAWIHRQLLRNAHYATLPDAEGELTEKQKAYKRLEAHAAQLEQNIRKMTRQEEGALSEAALARPLARTQYNLATAKRAACEYKVATLQDIPERTAAQEAELAQAGKDLETLASECESAEAEALRCESAYNEMATKMAPTVGKIEELWLNRQARRDRTGDRFLGKHYFTEPYFIDEGPGANRGDASLAGARDQDPGNAQVFVPKDARHTDLAIEKDPATLDEASELLARAELALDCYGVDNPKGLAERLNKHIGVATTEKSLLQGLVLRREAQRDALLAPVKAGRMRARAVPEADLEAALKGARELPESTENDAYRAVLAKRRKEQEALAQKVAKELTKEPKGLQEAGEMLDLAISMDRHNKYGLLLRRHEQFQAALLKEISMTALQAAFDTAEATKGLKDKILNEITSRYSNLPEGDPRNALNEWISAHSTQEKNKGKKAKKHLTTASLEELRTEIGILWNARNDN